MLPVQMKRYVSLLQPEVEPESNPATTYLEVFWQSPVALKLLECLKSPLCHGRGRGFEPRRPRHTFQMNMDCASML